jgi:hypothetical protein
MLQEAVDKIRGAVMICYPMGLPEWDFIRQCLEDREDLSGTNVSILNSSKCISSMLNYISSMLVTMQVFVPKNWRVASDMLT